MNLIGIDDEAMNFYSGKSTLLSSQMTGFCIHNKNGQLIVEINLKLMYDRVESAHKIRFIEVQEFSFYHNKDYIFYNISSYKFCKVDELFYLSLDPDEATNSISKKDNDFIMSKYLEAYTI